MRLALFSDQHFGPPARFAGKLRKLSHCAEALTLAFVKRMQEIEKPQLVVNLGDVIEDECAELDAQRYRLFLKALEGLTCPVLHVAGNHDSVNLDESTLLALWKRSGKLHYSLKLDGLHLIVLRSVELTGQEVRLPEEQLHWLAHELAQASYPTLLFVHHPLSDMDLRGNRWFERAPHLCRVANRRAVRRIVEESGKVRAVFNGHAHWNHLDIINGIPYVTLQSLVENVEDDAPGRAADAHAIVDASAKRLLINVGGAEPAHYQFDF